MQSISVKGVIREGFGKKETKKLRAQKLVPCVLYGGEKNINFSVEVTEFRPLIYSAKTQLVDLEVSGTKKKAIVKDVQFHPVSEDILHVDFLEVIEGKKINLEIPVKLTGFSKGVKEGGKLVLAMRKFKVRAIEQNLPDIVEVDVTELGIGKSIKVGTLNFDNFEITNPKDAIVCTVKTTRNAAKAAETEGGKGGKK